MEESAISWKEKQKSQLREELINTAVQLFKEKGFETPSVDEIVKRTGIAKGTFYLSFKTKSDIIEAVIEKNIVELETAVKQNVDQHLSDPTKAITEAVKTLMSFYETNPAMSGLLLNEQELARELPEEISSKIKQRYSALTNSLYERLIRTGMLQGQFREVDAQAAAIALSGMVNGVINSKTNLDDMPSKIIDIFIKGIKRSI